MAWTVLFHDDFRAEFKELPEEVQIELAARLKLLEKEGPRLGRPTVDTLNGSSFMNMKEIRFQKDGVWRFACAFNPIKQAIILCGGDKEGKNQQRFYKKLIKVADLRYGGHLKTLEPAAKKGK